MQDYAGQFVAKIRERGTESESNGTADSPYAALTTKPQPQDANSFSPASLVALPTTGWLTTGGNLYSQRFSPLTQISRRNVRNLKAVWRTRLDGSGFGPKYSGSAQPLVHDGTVYVITGENDVFALSVKTGQILWKFEATLEREKVNTCCGWTSHGVGLGDDKVYAGLLDGRLVALDRKTGQLVWSVQAERGVDGYSIKAAPLYYNGFVIVGFAGADSATRGRIKAFKASDGALAWTFYTVPGPGEKGHETWPANGDAWKFGGGAPWHTPSIDPGLGLIYFQTANPNPDLNGAIRPGDNLFTVSVMALEVETGKYRWHYQMVHHDLWDYDGASPVVLFDAEIGGRPRRGLAAPGKTGWVYLLDRETGEPLIGIDEKPVPQEPRQATAATQPHPIGDAFVPQHVDVAPEGVGVVNGGRIFTPFWTTPTAYKPGSAGGANWPGSSYDPVTQTLYVCATDQMSHLTVSEKLDPRPRAGEPRYGGVFGTSTIPPLGVFAALDVKTNRLVWQQHWSDSCYSGSVATAGGLIFVGRNDGRFTALDSSDGSLLWGFQTGAGVNAPPSVFEYEGRQYVVVFTAGSFFARSARGDSVWLFALDGTLDPVDPYQPIPVASTDTAPSGPGDIARGRKVYFDTCVFCHGQRGDDPREGGYLLLAGNANEIRRIVTSGRNQMPAFGSQLTPSQINDVAAFVAAGVPK
jgi:alcohol dehydrogenase (cytochrome c)